MKHKNMKGVEHRNIKRGTVVQLRGFCEGLKMLVVIPMYHFHISMGSLANLGVIFQMLSKHICKVTVFLFRDIEHLKCVFFFFCFLHKTCLLGSFYCSVEKYRFFPTLWNAILSVFKIFNANNGNNFKVDMFPWGIFFICIKQLTYKKLKNLNIRLIF